MKNQSTQTANNYVFWDKEFLENNNIIAHLSAITLVELTNKLQQIETLVQENKIDFEQLVDLSYNIICRVPVPIVKVDVPYIIRCRTNKKDEPFFTTVSQLSYNPKSLQGRFNLEHEPLFYASPPVKKENGFPPELCAIFETNKDLKDPTLIITDDRYITLGYWAIKKEFFAVALSFYLQAHKNNETVSYMNNFFADTFQRKFTSPSRNLLLCFYNYLSSKAGTIYLNENDYYITTAFRHALARYYGKELKAILYSSSMTENRGLNLAITKDLIDVHDIIFGHAIMYKVKKNKQISHCTEFVSANEINEFKFELIN